MNFENIKIPKYVKQFIEDYIEVIDSGKIDELLQSAIVEAELSESNFNTLCNILNDIDLPAFEERDKLFTDLFDQYMEMNESDYFMDDADRLVEIMDTLSTAECLGLDFNKIVFLLSQWSANHPDRIAIEGSNLNDLKIRFFSRQWKYCTLNIFDIFHVYIYICESLCREDLKLYSCME